MCLQITCRIELTIEHGTTGVAVAAAIVRGSWSSLKAATGWPSAELTQTTSAAGVVVFESPAPLPTTTGNGCTFTVKSISKTDFTAATSSTKAVRTQW